MLSMYNNRSSYAVLFKVHFWDEFVARQFSRLCKRVTDGDVYIIVDETHRPISGMTDERIIRMTRQTPEDEGYLVYPTENVFWYNTDYQLYHFVDNFPDYKFIVICEYDCVVNIKIFDIVARMANDAIDFVGQKIKTPAESWHWKDYAKPYYDEKLKITGRLLCFAALSKLFILKLKQSRLEHSRLARKILDDPSTSDQFTWPNNEAFVGAEIEKHSISELSLSEFGDMRAYDWAPAHLEGELQNLADCAIVHPVLDKHRFIASLSKLKWTPNDLFVEGSSLAIQMQGCGTEDVVRCFLNYYIKTRDYASISELKKYAEHRVGKLSRRYFNVALNKSATQSTVCRWSRLPNISDDAKGGVDGLITGNFGFHTDFEAYPWWCVDLEQPTPVQTILIYFRTQFMNRSRTLSIMGSLDLVVWTPVYDWSEKGTSTTLISPLEIKFSPFNLLRFVRIQLNEVEHLHLDQVEIYI